MKGLCCWGVIVLLWSSACQSSIPPPLDGNDAAVLVRVPPKLTAEERALANQLANRMLLQSVVDGNTALERQEMPFSCSAQQGGLLVQLSDSTGIHSWRLARTQAAGQEIVHWYYRAAQLVLVVHERSQWQGEEELIVQTLFYTRGQTVLHCQQKSIKESAATRAVELERAELLDRPVDAQFWEQLQTLETRLELPTHATEQWATQWCAD